MEYLHTKYLWLEWVQGFCPRHGQIIFVLQRDKYTLRVGKYKSWTTPSGPAGQVESLIKDEGLIPLGFGWLPNLKELRIEKIINKLSAAERANFLIDADNG